MFIAWQQDLLKVQEKKRWKVVSSMLPLRKTQLKLFPSIWKFLLLSKFLVFNLSMSSNHEKVLSLLLHLDCQIQRNGGGGLMFLKGRL